MARWRSRVSRTGSSAGETGPFLVVAVDLRRDQTCLHVGVPGDSRRRFFDAKSKPTGEWGRFKSARVGPLPDFPVPADCSNLNPAGFNVGSSCLRTGDGVDPAGSMDEAPRIIPTNQSRIDEESGVIRQCGASFQEE